VKLTYIQQSGSPPVGDGGDQYTGLDRFGRVIDQRWIKDSSGADLERVEYGFDRASNRVWRDNTVADALSANQDEFYTYDGLNQLLTLQRGTLNSGKTGITGTPTWEEDFTFDPTGNWNNYVNQVSGTTTLNQPRTHNAVNEVETISGSSALIQQNAAGNMVKAPQPTDWSSAYTMTYDAWQRLVKVKNGSTTTAIYAYDGQSRRTTKVIGSTTRHYYYSSQWQILEERLNAATTADRQFVWGLMGLDNLILRDRGSERFYSLQDVFSCTAIADITGAIQERYGYNAFGLSRVMDADFNVISASSYDWETRFDNYRFDAESNFYQVRFRYLHPTLGRWLTRDPLYEPRFKLLRTHTHNPPAQLFRPYNATTANLAVLDVYQGNPYQFTLNNPLNYNDFDGLWVICCRSGNPEPSDPSLTWLVLHVVRHCQLDPGSTCSNGDDTYPVTKSNSGKMDNGKCCSTVTDKDIAACMGRHPYSAGKGQPGDNCQTSVIQGLGNCCLKSNWKPNWYAGDPYGQCLEWKTIWVRDREGGMVPRAICVKYQPYPINQTCSAH